MRWLASLALALALTACASAGGGENEVRLVMERFPLQSTQADLAVPVTRYCASSSMREYTPAEAAPYSRQSQIDCEGYAFRGAGRKLELLINEGALGFYWLMIAPQELAATREALIETFGAPTCETERYTIFNRASVALRREPAEILVALPPDFQAITGGC